MATKTIINCMESSINTTISSTTTSTTTTNNTTMDVGSPAISIIIDAAKQTALTNPSSNVIKIQHSCQESPLMNASNSSNNNNKTLIDINRNNRPSSDLAKTPDGHLASASTALLSCSNVVKVNCLTSREMKENAKPMELKLETTKLFTNGSKLETGNELRAQDFQQHNNDHDHNEHHADDHHERDHYRGICLADGQEKEKSLTKEFTKMSKESGQTTKTSSSSITTTTTTTNISSFSTSSPTQTSQQVNNGNSKCTENINGQICINQTNNLSEQNGQDTLDNNEHNADHLHKLAHDHLRFGGHNDVQANAGSLADEANAVLDSSKHSLANGNSNSLLTKADTATTQLRLPAVALTSKLTINENSSAVKGNSEEEKLAANENQQSAAHVVKIQINSKKLPEKQISIVKIENPNKNETEKYYQTPGENHSVDTIGNSETNSELHLQIQNIKMVQKPLNNHLHLQHHQQTQQQQQTSVTVSGANNTTSPATMASSTMTSATNASSGSTTVTELNVTNPNYLYYMMSSGQFSPCDTLDSGTGSDLESQQLTSQSPTNNHPLLTKQSSNGLEMHLKTTKIRVSNSNKEQRNCSFTDSEESEASSLSCDSLHSSEFIRQSSSSPIQTKTPSPSSKILGSYLPDSLLRDIKNLKFSNSEYEAENENEEEEEEDEEEEQRTKTNKSVGLYESLNSPQDYLRTQNEEYVQTRNCHNSTATNLSNGNGSSNSNTLNGNNTAHIVNNINNIPFSTSALKRSSLPSKTFVLNQEDGTFIDTKMNSMPRKYEADKYYNFHVNEHANFRTFGNNSTMGALDGGSGDADDSLSMSEYDTRSMQDDVFAGYKDIRCGSATSTIRSSKGTVRGVKNRVRNGIATFLQLQQPNLKNYKEKDSGKVVLYTTSMGIIRDTYAKCSNVKQILRTLLIKFEERDVFMSVEYQQEIKERMHSEIIKVPQLFVEGQHIGDADTVERLNESGELRQLLKPYKSISTTFTCQTCGGYRLLPCPSCNGSKKSVHRNHFTAEFVALKCMNCDEVGLVKCHNC